MKKVAVIWSSPNTDGLTASAKNRIMEGLKDGGAECTEIHLNSRRLEHCRACGDGLGSCAYKGHCVIEDDFADIYEELVGADGIVWISAVYWADITECSKAFFDRLRRCDAFRNNFLKGKRCILIACAGGKGGGSIECLKHMEDYLILMSMRAYDRISVVRYNKDYILDMLPAAGKRYAEVLETGFNMGY